MVLLEVNHKDLREIIRKSYETQNSLYIWGTTGIGKSWSTEAEGRKIAENEGREFVSWNRVSKKEKHEIEKNPENYFVFIDIRLSQMDPSDLKGLPALNGSDTVEWKIPYWLHICSLPGMKGFLFFDEINLAPPSIQASAYQLILDRALGEVTISDGIAVLAAGNRIEDRANVYDLPKPLQNRFCHITLKIPNYEEWTTWALENKIDDRIIAFLNAYPTKLMGKINTKSNDMAFPTPRSWSKGCSNYIKGEKDLKIIERYASASVGMGTALEFASFLKFQKQIDWKAILKDPKKAGEIKELDMKYSLLALASEWYGEHHKPEDLDKIFKIANSIQPEFAILLMRFCINKHKVSFMKHAPTLKSWTEIWDKYGKYFEV